ncbi:Ig-like domain-containing protein, partial [Sphaerisporangium sp. NPDC051017]|uniref:Ig-like domain-containing protein n=1 Tax=Sphaerisporangium sp. NPDC051017 TaxID=3154636 RepID=UPI0034424789
MDTAKAEAKRTGKEVEIPSLHTENMTTVATPGGKTVKTYVSLAPVRAKRQGQWQAIDPTLIVADGVVKPNVTALDITLSNGGDGPLLTAKGDSLGDKDDPGEIVVATPGKLPVPELSGNTATYRSAYGRNIDLVVTITSDSYQHQIVIREKPSKPLKLTVPIDPPNGMSLGKSSSGKPAALADGKEVADLSALPVLDAKEIVAPGTGKAGTATTTLTGSGDDAALVVTPDAAFLADPATTYPVTVAAANPTPWHGAGAPADTFIANGGSYVNGSYMANSNALFAGRRDGYNYRSYLKFNLTGAPFIGREILDANIILWNYISSACGNVGDISMHRISGDWTPTSLTWSNQPLAVADGYVVNPYGKDQNCSDWMAEGELWYSIEQITQAWSNGSPNHGVMIRAIAESGSNNWRQYLSGNYPETAPDGSHHPYFFVEYDAPAPIKTEWVQFEMDDVAGVFPTYNEAKANTVQPWDTTANWAVTNAEADAIEKLGIGVANEVTSSKLQPLGGDAETDPSELDPDEIPAGTPIDQTPPTITETRPDDSSVPVNTAITVTFSEPVWGANIALKDSAGTAVQGTTALDAAKKVLTFTPSQALRHATTYSVEVNGATDADGQEVTPRLWQFTTEVDVTPPTVTSTEPAADAVNVPLQTAVKVTFSEPVTDTVIGVKDGSGADVPGSVSTDGDKVWTFTPAAPLAWNGTYAVQVSGAKDASGNTMAPHSWSFATVTDTAAPTVAHVSPAGGATGVSVKTKVVVRFSEAVSDAQITAADAAGAPVLGDIAVDAANTTWTLTFGGPLNPETVHTVSVSGGSDPAGNVMEPYSWSFTTAQPDTVAPTVTASSPEPNAVDVALGGPIKATLSEPVSEGQIVVKDPAGGIVAGTLAADSTTVLSFTPTQPLAERTKYTVEVTGAKDDAGNVMALHTWSFTTKELPPPPNSPTVASEYVRPTNTAGAVTTLTPEFRAVVTDPDGRSMTLTVEIEHDPTIPSQGTGAIWTGTTTTPTTSGNFTGIFVPSGKLSDGWKVRWRARATASGVNGAWTTWHSLTVDISKPTVASEYVRPTNTAGAVTTLTPEFRAVVTDP